MTYLGSQLFADLGEGRRSGDATCALIPIPPSALEVTTSLNPEPNRPAERLWNSA